MENVYNEISDFQSKAITMIFNKMRSKNKVNVLYEFFDKLFYGEHKFTIKELSKYNNSDLFPQYERNANTFKRSIGIILNILIN